MNSCCDESQANRPHVLLKFFDEFIVFLVPPGGAKGRQLVAQRRSALLEFRIECLQIAGEPSQLIRIDNGLRHGGAFYWRIAISD